MRLSQLSRRMLLGLGGTLCFGTVVTALTLAVKYKPYGVPDHRREEYDQMVAKLEQRQQLLLDTQNKSAPFAVVPTKVHDFGLIDPESTASHSFEIRNEGSDPLALQVVDTSCKCTVGNVSNSLLEPGETSEVTLTWNTGQKVDQYEQTATILTNDPRMERINFTVKGTVRSKFVAPDLIEFGSSDLTDTADSEFAVYSQQWDDFTVVDASGDIEQLEWYAEPISNEHKLLRGRDARSAWMVRVLGAPNKYGDFSGEITLTIRPNSGEGELVRTIPYSGRVRAPIGFYSPEIHKNEGLDIGTVVSGKQHEFHLLVRARGEESRKIEVLDVKPDELSASLSPLEAPGSYRLTLQVAADCPLVVFNAPEKHGYVQVGDPTDKGFSNWFPLYGAVVELQN